MQISRRVTWLISNPPSQLRYQHLIINLVLALFLVKTSNRKLPFKKLKLLHLAWMLIVIVVLIFQVNILIVTITAVLATIATDEDFIFKLIILLVHDI